MVAPASRTRGPAPTPALRRARQVVAKTLLPASPPDPSPSETAPRVTPWRAWLLAAWIVAVAAMALLVQWM
jgi:hypothetical protein